MLNAQEAHTIAVNATYAKIEKGKEKARNSIPTIEGGIIQAAKEGEEYIVIHPLRMISTDSAEEQSGYLAELINILTKAQYKVEYHVSTKDMRIGWAQ